MSEPRAATNQVLALLSLVLIGLLLVVVVATVADNFVALLVAIIGLGIAAAGMWWAITERMPRRLIGLGAAGVGLAVVLGGGALAAQDDRATGRWFLALALAVGAATCARLALATTLHRIDLAKTFPAFVPVHPVLICNPLSGGGKVQQFGIIDKARALGVEVVLLERGLDLEQLARDAVARGADCLAMAGGDGSQALVASIAIEHDLPFVCISAGTRNHFALDLGLDRSDPSTGLTAFSNGVLRHVDYARVGDRLFVNNVSLGVYASIVEQDEYRGAKLATTSESLPTLLGRTAEPFDLQFRTPAGEDVAGAFIVLVSNNPYILGPFLDVSQRRSLTTGSLGVFAIATRTGRDAAELMARALAGRAGADPNLHTFTTETFQVRSRSGTADVGIDGEALTLPTPLDFRIYPRGLTVLVPADNPEVTMTKHYRALGVTGLWDIARGREPELIRELA